MYWVIEKDSNWLIICELCWKSFNKLWSHIRMTHNMLTSDYRKQFGIDVSWRLMSDTSIALASKRNKENYDTVVTENLVDKWVDTRYIKWHEWRTYNKMREQTKIRLYNKKNCRWEKQST